jgi:protein-S-isoprenylcysteine O-methyltransferase Ste14
MDGLPIASAALRGLAGMTILFQLGLLVAVPIPSPVASRRMWARRARREASSADTGRADPLTDRLLPLCALAGLLAVIAAVIWPGGAGTFLLPAESRFPGWLAPTGGVCLLTGNGVIAAAVFTLKRRTAFDAAGQSRRLLTDGVFGLIQHPIVSGLGMIYLGFFLAFPSPLVLTGLGCYAWHQKRRLTAEEDLLEQHFGQSYREYRRRVGRFWPRWSAPGRCCVRRKGERSCTH